MIINDRYRFVFVHVPKTGGTSIQRSLERVRGSRPSPRGLTKHESASEIAARCDVTGYRLFAFVRNPWDRFASLHRYLKLNGSHPVGDDLNTFALQLDARETWLDPIRSIRPQTGFMAPDVVIGRYESLVDDFQRICASIGYAPRALGHKNQTVGNPVDYRDLYSDLAAEIVGKRYAEDVSQFGYAFDP